MNEYLKTFADSERNHNEKNNEDVNMKVKLKKYEHKLV